MTCLTAYTASQAGLIGQLKHIRLAAEAGVKLFIPCEYTLEFDSYKTSPHVPGKELSVEDMSDETYPLVKLRREAVELCKELGMACLRVVTGEYRFIVMVFADQPLKTNWWAELLIDGVQESSQKTFCV